MNRTHDPRHYSIPLAMVVLAGLVHAGFEDWLFCRRFLPLVYLWSLRFYSRILSLTPWVPAAVLFAEAHACRPPVWASPAQPMIRLFINGLAASAGGGLRIFANVIPISHGEATWKPRCC